MKFSKIAFVSALLLIEPFVAAQNADTYPNRPVTLVVPSGPAGGTDLMARLVADRLGKALKQTFIVDNKPGANGILGAENVAHAPHDGYRLLFGYAAGLVVNPSLYKKISYDVEKDLAPIAQIGRTGNLLLVNPALPVKTLKEFVDYAKARPDQLNYCSWGTGSGGHLSMESLKRQAGLAMTHVPFKGSAACVQDIIAGHVQAGFGDVSSTVELVRAGKVRALATSGPTRIPNLPDVPTMNEAGFSFTTYSWYGLMAPAGTPRPIIDKLNAAVRDMLTDPVMVARLRELNLTDLPLTKPEEFAATIHKDLNDWGVLVRTLNLKIE
ncbi:MAG: tripartite tricarboxylate transporter substrate binding protein [Rhodoferax sp.]|nr:tripartite tricarboxylate transporter substrate binding protein [Rhodoferax sp.]